MALGLVLPCACLSPPAPPAGDSGPAALDAAPDDPGPDPVDPAVLGNVLTLTFDGDDSPSYLRDRSGGGRHGDQLTGTRIDSERLGDAIHLNGGQSANIPADPGLAIGEALTLEAWVRLEPADGFPFAIFSNYDSGETPPTDYSFEINEAGRIRLITSDTGGAERRAEAEAGPPVAPGVWSHVAVTWAADQVRFYMDGELVDERDHPGPFMSAGSKRFYQLGVRAGNGLPFTGDLDEVKVSDRAKSAEEVARSMMFDGRELTGRCGDRFAEATDEICDGQALCCDPGLCQPREEDAMCSGAGGRCEQGACVIDEPARVTLDLMAQWEFDELVDGTKVLDEVTSPSALDLLVEKGAPVQGSGHLLLDVPTRLATEVAATKIVEACAGTDAVSVEAWVTPANDTETGPARIITISGGADTRNITLAQDRTRWEVRVRSEGSTVNGLPRLRSASGDVEPDKLTHLLVTVGGGERRLYVDGRLRSTHAVPGRLSTWSPTFRLAVGDEFDDGATGDARAWQGTIHRAAVYCRALSELEVARNWSAGSEG